MRYSLLLILIINFVSYSQVNKTLIFENLHKSYDFDNYYLLSFRDTSESVEKYFILMKIDDYNILMNNINEEEKTIENNLPQLIKNYKYDLALEKIDNRKIPQPKIRSHYETTLVWDDINKEVWSSRQGWLIDFHNIISCK